MFRALVLLTSCCLAGCNLFVNVPDASKGDLQIYLTSKVDRDVCDFSLTPPGAPPSGNWLTTSVGPNSERTFKIRPGNYKVSVGCGTQFHGQETASLTTSTEIVVGVLGERFQNTNLPALHVAVMGHVRHYAPPRVVSQPQYEEGGGNEPAGETSCKPDGAEISDAADSHLCCGQHSTGVTRNLRNVTLCCSDMQSCNTLR